MSQPPLTFLERQWKAAPLATNTLIQSATQTSDRAAVPLLDHDYHRNVSQLGRRTLLSLGRWLYENCGPVRGAVDEMANYAVSTFLPQFAGQDAAWGRQAEAWLREHDRILCREGTPYHMGTVRRLLVKSVIVDGDFFLLLTRARDAAGKPVGWPFLQLVPAHRVGSREFEGLVKGGPFDGARIIDGVIVDDYGAALGYRVLGENRMDQSFTDVPAENVIPCFLPNYPGQLRGTSWLGASLFDWQDVKETRAFEKLAQKMMADRVFVVENEDGEPEEGRTALSGPRPTTPAEALAAPVREKFEGGTSLYFRAGTGSKLTAVTGDRPTANQAAFEERLVRGAFHALGWSMDFSLDPTKIGGASMRVVVEKINRQLDLIRDLIVEPAVRRLDGWRTWVAMDIGELPKSPEWWQWRYQEPAELTADAGYQSDISIAEIRANLTTPIRETARRGLDWETVQDDAIKWEKRLQERCKAEGVDASRILLLTPNGNPPTPGPQAGPVAGDKRENKRAEDAPNEP